MKIAMAITEISAIQTYRTGGFTCCIAQSSMPTGKPTKSDPFHRKEHFGIVLPDTSICSRQVPKHTAMPAKAKMNGANANDSDLLC